MRYASSLIPTFDRIKEEIEALIVSAKKYGFKLIKEYDQTENTMPTLDYAKYFVERFINPSFEYGVYSANKNFPKFSMIFKKFIGPKFNKKKEQLKLIDSNEFRKYRKYMIFLFDSQDGIKLRVLKLLNSSDRKTSRLRNDLKRNILQLSLQHWLNSLP